MDTRFRQFEKLRSAGQFDKAVAELTKTGNKGKLPPNILVLKGLCILLGSEASPYGLQDAEAAFREALVTDRECVTALLELAYLYLRVHDEPRRALRYFQRGMRIVRLQMTELIAGIAECLCETKSAAAAQKFVERAIRKPVDPHKVDEIVEYIKVLAGNDFDDVLNLLRKEVQAAHFLHREVRRKRVRKSRK